MWMGRDQVARPAKAPKRAKAPRPARARAKANRLQYGPARISDEAGLADAVAALKRQDPLVIGHLLETGGMPPLRQGRQGFAGLAAIIVSQQVSVASADAIYARLAAEIAPLDAPSLAAAGEDRLKACGLSRPKMRALRALAEAITAGRLALDELAQLEPDEAHARLIAVHGIGPWTADLFLLSCLGHPDAWPAGDLALQEAARLALGLRQRPDKARLESIGERWRPFRAVAARMLWTYYRHIKARRGLAGGMID
jgi:DNA-3-methyladenine glycosylase II